MKKFTLKSGNGPLKFKDMGSSTPAKQTTSSREKIDITYPERGFWKWEDELVVENPERTKLQGRIQEIYDTSKEDWNNLTEDQQNEFRNEMKEAQGKEFEETQKTHQAAIGAGTYEEYLLGVGGGEGSLSKEEWIELNKENIKGQFGTKK